MPFFLGVIRLRRCLNLINIQASPEDFFLMAPGANFLLLFFLSKKVTKKDLTA
jgi:hypothetical protein